MRRKIRRPSTTIIFRTQHRKMLRYSTGELTPERKANNYLCSEVSTLINQLVIFWSTAVPTPTFWLVRNPGSTLYSSQQLLSKSFYYSPIVCCRTLPHLLVGACMNLPDWFLPTPTPFGGSVSLTLPYTVQQTIAITNINQSYFWGGGWGHLCRWTFEICLGV